MSCPYQATNPPDPHICRVLAEGGHHWKCKGCDILTYQTKQENNGEN